MHQVVHGEVFAEHFADLHARRGTVLAQLCVAQLLTQHICPPLIDLAGGICADPAWYTLVHDLSMNTHTRTSCSTQHARATYVVHEISVSTAASTFDQIGKVRVAQVLHIACST